MNVCGKYVYFALKYTFPLLLNTQWAYCVERVMCSQYTFSYLYRSKFILPLSFLQASLHPLSYERGLR
jgi:hypothetical protein